MRTYYQMSGEEVMKQLNGGEEPLSEEQVRKRREMYGPNELAEGKKKNVLQIFLEQFKDFLIVILMIAAVVSGVLGDLEGMAVILVVITLNAVLGTVQTVKAEQSLDSLKKLSGPEAKVRRQEGVAQIPASQVTVGDQVLLDAGDFIPADGRLIESAGLKVDESALTGESVSVEKDTRILPEGEIPLGDRRNMVYSGSFVTYGRGIFLVTEVGMKTEVGKIAELLKTTSEKRTPLQINLDQFGKKLSALILIFCGLLFGISIFRGDQPGDAFLFAVALAVAAIPEALSSIVTIVLSFGTQKMAKEHAIIRKLQAVEGLGSVSVICSDKTGTLTQNKMTVEQCFASGRRCAADQLNKEDPVWKELLLAGVLCSDARVTETGDIGDPTETALLHLALQAGAEPEQIRSRYPREAENPFDSERKLMSTKHTIDGRTLLYVKGAVDVLLERLDRISENGQVRLITGQDRREIEEQNQEFSGQGLRVLAFAKKEAADGKDISTEDEDHLIFLGLAAMMDPPREESAAAVAECKKAGICPVMITGDHKITAAAIAKRIGILEEDSQACEGAVLDRMSDGELKDFVEGIRVYARVSPEHKIRIVRAWQEKGNIVAMTGDGVNDAPALKQADVGVAMGITGSEVSKDAAAMILTDDNFATIVKAVENGRNLYRNIKHSIQFLLSGNFGAILAVLAASVAALPLPFAPVHLLFINLLTDSLPAIALGLEPHCDDVMNEKPRPMNESILTKDFLVKIAVGGLAIGTTSMISFLIGYRGEGALLGSTMAFATLCSARLFHGFNCKSDRPVLFSKKLWNNRYLLGAFLLGITLITCVVTMPVLQNIFQVQPLNLPQLLCAYGLAALNLPLIQLLQALKTFRKS